LVPHTYVNCSIVVRSGEIIQSILSRPLRVASKASIVGPGVIADGVEPKNIRFPSAISSIEDHISEEVQPINVEA